MCVRSQRARWEHIDLEVDRSMFDLNVFSVINLTRVILPHMLTAKQGLTIEMKIIQIISIDIARLVTLMSSAVVISSSTIYSSILQIFIWLKMITSFSDFRSVQLTVKLLPIISETKICKPRLKTNHNWKINFKREKMRTFI